ncbi:MAG: hypothetical protein IKS55_06985 [Oscillospiraceae bacterium]|nr:hypothetical protein [Oscillospiraceae bacterium]
MVFLFWRCRFGFAYEDETFYLTIPYRFCLGDKPLLHEWHLSQLAGIILYPFVKLYLVFFHSTDGIVLFFRYFYTIVWGAGGLFLWNRLRCFSHVGAMAAAYCFVVYAPWSIMALSYQSMSFLFLLSSCMILITSDRPLAFIAAGILYSGSVLCNPYLAVLYPLFTVVMLVMFLLGRKAYKQIWLSLTIGILIVLIPFILFLLFSGKSSDYIRVLPMLMEDPEHPVGSHNIFAAFINRLKGTIYFAQNVNSFWKASVCAAAIITIAALVFHLNELGFLLVCADSIFLMMTYYFGYHTMNFFMFPACYVGAYCFLCSRDKDISTLFWGIWIPGILYALCHMFASNQYYVAFSHASGVAMLASIVIAARYVSNYYSVSKHRGYKIAVSCAFCALILCQFYCELSSRYHLVYWDKDISFQTIPAEEGPEKGILMSQDAYEYYDITIKDIRTFCDRDDVQKVLFMTKLPWLYLVAQKEYSTFSAWEEPVNIHTVERLRQYYSLYPEKIPDAVFFDRDYADLMPEFEKDGYTYDDDAEVSQYAYIMRK